MSNDSLSGVIVNIGDDELKVILIYEGFIVQLMQTRNFDQTWGLGVFRIDGVRLFFSNFIFVRQLQNLNY